MPPSGAGLGNAQAPNRKPGPQFGFGAHEKCYGQPVKAFEPGRDSGPHSRPLPFAFSALHGNLRGLCCGHRGAASLRPVPRSPWLPKYHGALAMGNGRGRSDRGFGHSAALRTFHGGHLSRGDVGLSGSARDDPRGGEERATARRALFVAHDNRGIHRVVAAGRAVWSVPGNHLLGDATRLSRPSGRRAANA